MPTTRVLLPGSLRRAAAATAAAGALVLAALGVTYAGDHSPGAPDTLVDGFVQRQLAGHGAAMHAVLHIADPVVVIVLQLVLVAVGLAVRSGRAVVLAVAGPAAANGLTEFVLKPMVGRTLHAVLVFPSGHTTSVSAVAAVLVVFLLGPIRPRRLGVVLGVALTTAACCLLPASALVALNYHYATDTLGGFATAVAAVSATGLVVDAVAARIGSGTRSAPAPVSPSR